MASEFRKDPLTDRWVLIAEQRAGRPDQFQHLPPAGSHPQQCPFCAGNEQQTPEAVAVYPAAQANSAGPPWQVRVVPNKFPAVQPDGAGRGTASGAATGTVRGAAGQAGHGLYQTHSGWGAHEVIIESPDHVCSLTQLHPGQVQLVLQAYRDRLQILKRDPRLKYAQVFKNVGPAAGASLEHTHSQLLAMPLVPTDLQQELAAARAFWQREGECIFCSLVEQELQAAVRIVAVQDNYVAWCPFASRFPYETWILPRRHASHFEQADGQQLAQASRLLLQVLARLEAALGRPAYNYLLHTGPWDNPVLPHYHWHLELFPRLTRAAGFEWGTGYFINPVAPERAAAVLRDVVL